MADIQTVLTGQRGFRPLSKATVEKEPLGRSQPTSNQTDRNGLPASESNKSHAVFGRITQSRQYAHSYGLKTVELKNRFAGFNIISGVQQKSVHEKKSKHANAALGKAPSGTILSLDHNSVSADLLS